MACVDWMVRSGPVKKEDCDWVGRSGLFERLKGRERLVRRWRALRA